MRLRCCSSQLTLGPCWRCSASSHHCWWPAGGASPRSSAPGGHTTSPADAESGSASVPRIASGRLMARVTWTETTWNRKLLRRGAIGRCVTLPNESGEPVSGVGTGAFRSLQLALALAAPLLGPTATASAAERFDTVVIDAGHGGSDVGAKGFSGVLEKDVALAVARNLAARLRAHGLRVVMTRDAHVRVPLEQRTAIANDARGDLFVSIHANASPDSEIHGSETYFLALEASDSGAAGVAQRENSAFAAEADQKIDALSDPFIALLVDMIS